MSAAERRPPVALASTGSFQSVLHLKPVCPHAVKELYSPHTGGYSCAWVLRNGYLDAVFRFRFRWKSRSGWDFRGAAMLGDSAGKLSRATDRTDSESVLILEADQMFALPSTSSALSRSNSDPRRGHIIIIINNEACNKCHCRSKWPPCYGSSCACVSVFNV